MKRSILAFLLALCATAASAQSNATPSLHVAMSPCQLFSGSLSANTTVHLDALGNCNIPFEVVTAVEVAVTVSAAGSGTLKLWEYDGTEPSSPIMSYNSGTTSSFAVPRLCAPFGDCFHDISAKSSSAITLTLVAVGFYLPPPEE